MEQPILITGAARSGTSLVAGITNICGAFGGDMYGKNCYNEKGMFENKELRDKIVKSYLRSIQADPMGQYPLPDVYALPKMASLRSKIENAMRRQGYKDGHWMYKGAKMPHIWPVFHEAFPEAKWVIVRRKTDDIINSCLKTGFMSAFGSGKIQKAVGAQTTREGWEWWVNEHQKRFEEMLGAGLNAQIVWPERMVDGDYSEIKGLINWLALEWKEGEVRKFIEPKLWKARKKGRNNGTYND
jgi:hypothetical protein